MQVQLGTHRQYVGSSEESASVPKRWGKVVDQLKSGWQSVRGKRTADIPRPPPPTPPVRPIRNFAAKKLGQPVDYTRLPKLDQLQATVIDLGIKPTEAEKSGIPKIARLWTELVETETIYNQGLRILVARLDNVLTEAKKNPDQFNVDIDGIIDGLPPEMQKPSEPMTVEKLEQMRAIYIECTDQSDKFLQIFSNITSQINQAEKSNTFAKCIEELDQLVDEYTQVLIPANAAKTFMNPTATLMDQRKPAVLPELSTASYVIMPTQRGPRIVMLLDGISKDISENHSSAVNPKTVQMLTTLVDKMKTNMDAVNEAHRNTETVGAALEIQNMIIKNSDQPQTQDEWNDLIKNFNSMTFEKKINACLFLKNSCLPEITQMGAMCEKINKGTHEPQDWEKLLGSFDRIRQVDQIIENLGQDIKTAHPNDTTLPQQYISVQKEMSGIRKLANIHLADAYKKNLTYLDKEKIGTWDMCYLRVKHGVLPNQRTKFKESIEKQIEFINATAPIEDANLLEKVKKSVKSILLVNYDIEYKKK